MCVGLATRLEFHLGIPKEAGTTSRSGVIKPKVSWQIDSAAAARERHSGHKALISLCWPRKKRHQSFMLVELPASNLSVDVAMSI